MLHLIRTILVLGIFSLFGTLYANCCCRGCEVVNGPFPGGIGDYAIIYRTTNVTLSPNDPVIFDTNGSFAPNSTFSHVVNLAGLIIGSPGTYFIRYIANTNRDQTTAVGATGDKQFDLFLNGAIVPNTTRHVFTTLATDSQTMVLESIVEIDSVKTGGSVLTLVNTDSVPFVLGEPGIRASLSITKIGY